MLSMVSNKTLIYIYLNMTSSWSISVCPVGLVNKCLALHSNYYCLISFITCLLRMADSVISFLPFRWSPFNKFNAFHFTSDHLKCLHAYRICFRNDNKLSVCVCMSVRFWPSMTRASTFKTIPIL